MSTVRENAEKLVAETCERQGVPVLITDPTVIARVAAILSGAIRGGGRDRDEEAA